MRLERGHDGKDGPALTAERLILTANMVCDQGFQVEGEVSLSGASIGGQLSFRGAHLDGEDRLPRYRRHDATPARNETRTSSTDNMLLVRA